MDGPALISTKERLVETEEHVISRRGFLQGAAAGVVSVAALGVLGACAPDADSSTGTTETTGTVSVSETLSADIVVVGAGISGLAATVQAAELGAKVITLESQGAVGGNGQGTEGIFAVGSRMQQEAGINITFREIIASEMETCNYRVNAFYWEDMVGASADNLEWLLGNGVLLSGVIDNYRGTGEINCFHWWKDGKGGVGYIPPMTAKAESLGATIMLNTAAKELIVTGGAVTGVYATKADGSAIQLNCKAVILASGGFAGNAAMLEDRGYDMAETTMAGFPGHNGDGLTMAVAAGGVDVSRNRCYLGGVDVHGFDWTSPVLGAINRPSAVWVNQDAARYASENAGARVPACAFNAVHSQRKSFFIVDSGMVAAQAANVENLIGELESTVEKNENKNMYKADTLEQLAAKAAIDPSALAETVARYNTFCKQGVDEDFNKSAEFMIPLETPPYYIFRQSLGLAASFGGIQVSRNMEVTTKTGDAIAGLYAVGTDACEMYRETYTINIPGSIGGHNVNSGRTAGRNAAALL